MATLLRVVIQMNMHIKVTDLSL